MKRYNILSNTKKEMFYSSLNSLLIAGLDFSSSFNMLIECEGNKQIKSLLSGLYEHTIKGQMLWQSMKECEAFSAIDYGVVKIGEETGKLSQALMFLSDYYHKNEERKKMIKNATSYPVIIFFTAILVISFMIMVIVPMFDQVYTRMGRELPLMTQFIVKLANGFPLMCTIIILTIVIMSILLYVYKEDERVKIITSELILHLPFIGEIIRKTYQYSFCRLLSLLILSGIPLLHGLHIMEEILVFYPYRKSLRYISYEIYKGTSFTFAMTKDERLYGKKLIALLRVGEETNTLGTMLLKQSDELSSDLEYKYKFLGNVLEPLLIIGVGFLVAIILIAMYLPMFNLSGIIY